MFTKIVEAHLEPLWLKVIADAYEPAEIAHNSALPGYEATNLMRGIGTATPQDIWILDLSTGEGATFDLTKHTGYDFQKIRARL